MLTARWHQLEMVKFLLKKGDDPDKSGAEWSTPFAWTTRKNHKEITEIFRDAGTSKAKRYISTNAVA